MTTREEELSAQVAMLRGALTLFTLKPGWASNLSRGQQAMVESALVGAHEADAWSELSAEVARLRELVAVWQSAMPLLSLDASKCLAEHDAKVRAESAARIEKLEAALRSISTLIVDHEASPTFAASNLAEAVGTARAALAPAGDAKKGTP